MSASEDVLTGFHFGLEIAGFISGYFDELSGVGSETEVIEHKAVSEGATDTMIHKVPGRLTWGDITLKRGITSNLDFWDWRQLVVDGKIADARQNGSILMYDQSMSLVAQWDFERAWPSKIDGPTFTSDANTYGVEELTLVHEGIARVS